MATAPDGLARRAELICKGNLRVSVAEVDALIKDLHGFEDFDMYRDGLLDARLLQQAEEVFRPTEVLDGA